MNLAKEIAAATEMKTVDVKTVLDSLTEITQRTLKNERKIRIPGLVIMTVKFRPKKAARPGRNPATGETVQIAAKPASSKLKVSPVKELRELVAGLKVIKP